MAGTCVSIIAAMSTNRVIGVNNSLPWRLPADLAYFKELTLNRTLIMGRKTFESLPGGKPLPGRKSIILTRDKGYNPPGCVVAQSIDDALDIAGENEVFFIGGENVYTQAIPFVDRIYLTEVHVKLDGDAFFPVFDNEDWVETSRKHRSSDDRNLYDMDFVVYDRRK